MDAYSSITVAATIAGLIISLIGIFIALLAIYIQSIQNNRTLGITIVRELENEFVSERLLEVRLKLATLLLRKDATSAYSEDLLDFFDSIGIYQERGGIDLETVWEMFFFWYGHYWNLIKTDAYNLENQYMGVSYYNNAKRLYKKLYVFGRKHRKLPIEEEYYTEETLNKFLLNEIQTCKTLLGFRQKDS